MKDWIEIRKAYIYQNIIREASSLSQELQTATVVLPDRVKQQETANEASHPLSLQCLAWFSYLNQNDRFRRKAPGNLTENVVLMLPCIDQSSGVPLRLHANNE